ncbi:uncharacterized protein LOC130693773 [Daphnia carinata]|uniref:uncharacterized protein LOC130693773 n=1 Tax=Daphnia carinata TaxID=120202 RepID=UPI00257B667D|nr:uncharacterized protein LOC130693773 [Daphnia carinata]XP_057372956.1 uncharacterized protein LOC130693773 [Daphnia carinata]
MEEDWNIDKHRNKFELDEQWELKRKFMETHKHRFSKERVICLAQVLVNMEFLGAKYPIEITNTVMELSKNIVEGFRKNQKARLQRTFVEASEAASLKVKETLANPKLFSENVENDECVITGNSSPIYTEREVFVQSASKKLAWDKDKDTGPRIPNFVLIMTNIQRQNITEHANNRTNSAPSYREIIETSARLSSVELKLSNIFFTNQGKWQTVLHLGGREIVSSLHENKKMSERGVCELAFPILERKHYQLVIIDQICISIDHFIKLEEDIRQARAENSVRTTITKDVMQRKHNWTSDLSTNSAFVVLSKEESIVPQPLNSAVAMKMMKKMGWAEGTGLGARKQGILEPIKGDVIVDRKGVGYHGSGGKDSFDKIIRRYLSNYVNSSSLHTIIFSSEFSTNQRKTIHLIARKMGLYSLSTGKEPNRQLTVRRSVRKRPLVELLNELIDSQGEDPLLEKMNTIPPTE